MDESVSQLHGVPVCEGADSSKSTITALTSPIKLEILLCTISSWDPNMYIFIEAEQQILNKMHDYFSETIFLSFKDEKSLKLTIIWHLPNLKL